MAFMDRFKARKSYMPKDGYLGAGIGQEMDMRRHVGYSRMFGEGDLAGFNVTSSAQLGGTRRQIGGTGRDARQMTSTAVNPRSMGPQSVTMRNESHINRVLETRRQAKLSASDPGLSTRGRINAPGRGGRPVTGRLEGRGVRPDPGTRVRPGRGPIGGTGRGLEDRGVRPAPGSRRIPNRNLPAVIPSTRGQRTTGPTVTGSRVRAHRSRNKTPSSKKKPSSSHYTGSLQKDQCSIAEPRQSCRKNSFRRSRKGKFS